VFSPATVARYTTSRDPYALSVEGFEGETRALTRMAGAVESRETRALFATAPRLGARAYYEHLHALLNAPDAAALEAAFDALTADLERLR
jgi:hypothetical protein